MSLQQFTIKQSAKFAFAIDGFQLLVDGVPVTDFTGWTLTCSIYSVVVGALGSKLADATVTPTPGALLIDGGDCASWPVGQACFDVLAVGPGGFRAPTKTVRFTIEPAVTGRTEA